VYIGIPDAREVHIVCTNSLWHLALVGVLLAFAAAPRSLFGRICDIIIFALATVSGPFAIVLLPFVFVFSGRFYGVRSMHARLSPERLGSC
jgi:hypothetical protein